MVPGWGRKVSRMRGGWWGEVGWRGPWHLPFEAGPSMVVIYDKEEPCYARVGQEGAE